MIRMMQNKVFSPALGAVILGITLAGCGTNGTENTTEGTTAQAPAATTETASSSTQTKGGDHDHDAETLATMAKFFPGAQLSPKPFPFSDELGKHMGEEAGVKFTGKEKDWQVFEATQNGQRAGLAVMTHSALPDGKDMHVAFAVNPKFALTHVVALDAPDNAKMQGFIKQIVGKTYSAPFKVGQDLKTPAGLSPQVAQISADAVKKGLVILEENFNAAHGEVEAAHSHGTAAHKEGDGHTH